VDIDFSRMHKIYTDENIFSGSFLSICSLLGNTDAYNVSISHIKIIIIYKIKIIILIIIYIYKNN